MVFNRLAFAAFEAWAVTKLLRSQTFHRAVTHVYRKVNKLQPPAEELGGTKLDVPKGDSFLKHFADEVKDQMGFKQQQKPPK
ncbi:hypothetical protein BT63DRAFT_461200 [Microthyrium microscopicum]|uniref:Uncharacterized protein n=1 Tax=Microthyrium microscopicum TaxID=703497 RepID=A0A6A6TXT1_9PEZI|nr:hypothetical protein BT63DRAFT_461200 [Microthyrium microscopicum]